MSIFVVIAIISIVLGLLLMSLNKWLVKMSHGKL
jgi:hypothetical protein